MLESDDSGSHWPVAAVRRSVGCKECSGDTLGLNMDDAGTSDGRLDGRHNQQSLEMEAGIRKTYLESLKALPSHIAFPFPEARHMPCIPRFAWLPVEFDSHCSDTVHSIMLHVRNLVNDA